MSEKISTLLHPVNLLRINSACHVITAICAILVAAQVLRIDVRNGSVSADVGNVGVYSAPYSDPLRVRVGEPLRVTVDR